MLSLVNETDGALLLTGCDDGAVKIWRDYGEIDKHSLVTAWNTLPSQPLVSDAIGSVPLSYYKPSTTIKSTSSPRRRSSGNNSRGVCTRPETLSTLFFAFGMCPANCAEKR